MVRRVLPSVTNPPRDTCVPLFVPDDNEWKRHILDAIRRLTLDRTWQHDENMTALIVRDRWKNSTLIPLIEALESDEPCTQDSGFDCVSYDARHETIHYYPNDPFDTSITNDIPQIASGMGWWRISDPDAQNSDWYDLLLEVFERTSGYRETDVITMPVTVPQNIFQVIGDWFAGNGNTPPFPFVKITTRGTGVLEINMLNVPFGGSAIIVPDFTTSLTDFVAQVFNLFYNQNGDIPEAWEITELERDIFAIPPEISVNNIKEIRYETEEQRDCYVFFVPRLNDTFPFIFPVAGFRDIEVCDNLEILGTESGTWITQDSDEPYRIEYVDMVTNIEQLITQVTNNTTNIQNNTTNIQNISTGTGSGAFEIIATETLETDGQFAPFDISGYRVLFVQITGNLSNTQYYVGIDISIDGEISYIDIMSNKALYNINGRWDTIELYSGTICDDGIVQFSWKHLFNDASGNTSLRDGKAVMPTLTKGGMFSVVPQQSQMFIAGSTMTAYGIPCATDGTPTTGSEVMAQLNFDDLNEMTWLSTTNGSFGYPEFLYNEINGHPGGCARAHQSELEINASMQITLPYNDLNVVSVEMDLSFSSDEYLLDMLRTYSYSINLIDVNNNPIATIMTGSGGDEGLDTWHTIQSGAIDYSNVAKIGIGMSMRSEYIGSGQNQYETMQLVVDNIKVTYIQP